MDNWYELRKVEQPVNMERREFNPRGKYLRLRANGNVFKVETIVVQDAEKGTYYVTDEGSEIKLEDCFIIDIPGVEGFSAVIKKYPDAIEQRCLNNLKIQAELKRTIHDKYNEVAKVSVLEKVSRLGFWGKEKDDFLYRKGYIDGLESGKRTALIELLQLIDFGIADDLDELKQKLVQRIENEESL